jgi:hypothetical protein
LRGPDPSVDERIAKALHEIRQGVDAPTASLATFEAPLHRLVEDYVDLRLTQTYASNIAAVLFARLILTIPSSDPDIQMAALKGQIDHMVNLTSQIRDERQKYDVGSFYSLTRLAMFWGETAQILAKQTARRASPDLAELLEKKASYVEEFAAHYLNPTLSHPFLLVPFGAAVYLRSTTYGLPSLEGIYDGAGVTTPGALQPEQIWSNLQRNSAAARSILIPWDTYTRVLSKELAEHLQMFLLTMSLGRTMRP